MKDTVRSICISTTVCWLIFGMVGVFPAMMSVMMFDAPGSELKLSNQIAFWSLITFPLVCSIAATAPWMLVGFQRYRSAVVVAMSPIANLIALATLVALGL